MEDRIQQLYKEWQRLQPISETAQERLRRKFMLEFNYNSNHIEGNTLTYGQTEILLLFGRVVDSAKMKDLEDMKASNVGLNMMQEQATSEYPLTETFIRQLHKTIMREDYVEHRSTPDGKSWHYTVHAGIYKTRPNSVITPSGERFEYASPEETPALMTDLVNWYKEEEEHGVMTPIELASLFHFRYIRIHPFEDGNGRMARLLVNFILLRHGYPMIVVKSTDKDAYLDALIRCDENTGPVPADGAHASLKDIMPFVNYMKGCLERALTVCIKAAKGESIEEDEDFMKELRIVERQKKQDMATEQSKRHFSTEEVWNVLEFVYFPIVQEFQKAIDTADSVFRFSQIQSFCLLSKKEEMSGGLVIGKVSRNTTNPQIQEFINNAKSMWFHCEIMNPMKPQYIQMTIDKRFYIRFFSDHYFVDGILNKNFVYGTYPTEAEQHQIISQFKEELLDVLKKKI